MRATGVGAVVGTPRPDRDRLKKKAPSRGSALRHAEGRHRRPSPFLVHMPVVRVRIVCVRVPQFAMVVSVDMAGARGDRRFVEMVVMGVTVPVNVFVLVRHRLVQMFVAVMLGQMQVHADPHEDPGDEQGPRYRLVEQP